MARLGQGGRWDGGTHGEADGARLGTVLGQGGALGEGGVAYACVSVLDCKKYFLVCNKVLTIIIDPSAFMLVSNCNNTITKFTELCSNSVGCVFLDTKAEVSEDNTPINNSSVVGAKSGFL